MSMETPKPRYRNITDLIGQLNAGMTEHYLRKDYRSMYDLWQIVSNQIDQNAVAHPIAPFEFVERHEDMSQKGRLSVGMDNCGDLIVTILPDPNEYHRLSVEFCTVGSGGGKSDNTRRALVELYKAMRADNEEKPINR